MAEFNKPLQDALPPQYVNASQGKQYQGNQGMSMLTEGFTKAFEGLIKGLDESVQENIRQDTQGGFDAINKEFGINAATVNQHPIPGPNDIQNQTAANQPLPQTIENAQRQLQSLQQGFASGAINETHYWGRMNSLVRQLRGKYPGYRTQIDNIVSDVTGSRPANQLRNELFQEWKTQGTKAEKTYETTVENGIKQGHFRGFQFVGGRPIDPETNQPMTLDAMRTRIATREGDEKLLQQNQAQLNFDVEREKVDKKKVQSTMGTELSQKFNTILRDASTSIGSTYAKINKMVGDSQSGLLSNKPPSPEELQQLTVLFDQLQGQIRALGDSTYIKPWDETGDPKKNYKYWVPKEDFDKEFAAATLPLDTLRQAIFGKEGVNVGLLKATSTYLESQKNYNQRTLLTDVPALQYLKTLTDIAGPQATGLYMTLIPGGADALQSSILQAHKLRYQARDRSDPQFESLADDAKDAKKKGAEKQYFDGQVGSFLNEIKSKELSPEMKGKTVQYIFGPKNNGIWAQMDPVTRHEYFKKITSPEVHAEMVKLRNAGDTVAYDQYRNWTLNASQAYLKSAVADLNNLTIDRRQVMVQFDPTANQFILVPNPEAKKPFQEFLLGGGALPAPFGPMIGAGNMSNTYGAALQSLEKVNDVIRNVSPIIIDAKQSVPEQIQFLLKSFGLKSAHGQSGADLINEAVVLGQPKKKEGDSTNPFGEATVNLWQKFAPFQPEWVAPQEVNKDPIGSLGDQAGEKPQAPQQQQQPQKRSLYEDPKNTYVLGDSLGVGIANASRTNNLSENGLRVTDPKLANNLKNLPKGANAVISIGTNDAYAGEQGVTEFGPAVQQLIQNAQAQGVNLTLVGPPKLPKNDEFGIQIDKILKDTAAANGVQYVSSRDQKFDRAPDGVHFTPRGYGQFAQHAGLIKPPSLDGFIASGEGSWNSYNRGIAGDSRTPQNLVDMSVGEIMRRQSLPRNHPEYLFAVGQFQIIPDTMRSAVWPALKAAGFSLNDKFSPELQTTAFREVLLTEAKARGAIRNFITGASDNVNAAILDLAKEFASVGVPQDGPDHKGRIVRKGSTFYGGIGGNAASLNPDRAAAVLQAERQQYQTYLSQGLSPAQAWRKLSNLKDRPTKPTQQVNN